MMSHRAFGERQHGTLALELGVRLEGEYAYEIHAETTEEAIVFNEICREKRIPELQWFPPLPSPSDIESEER